MNGVIVPAYEVIRSIPHQGVAEVELCAHPIFGDEVIRKRVDTLGREDAIAFLEPRLLHEIRHPNVAEIYNALSYPEDVSTIVEIYMPYYREGSVHDALMEEYEFSHRQAVELTRDVLSALTYLHESMGYLHRDVKPSNILLELNRTRARLTDFGSAAKLNQHGTARGSLGRSPLYEPPEASRGPTDIRGDLYATGLCLYEMLNGRFPYEDLDFEDVTTRLTQGRRALPDRMYRLHPWVPNVLRRVVNRALGRDPARRYPTAAQFRAALLAHNFIDWRRVEGEGLEGIWIGEWIGRRGRARYRIESQATRGRLRAACRRESAAGSRRFTVGSSLLVDLGQADVALTELFEEAGTDAAQRFPV